MAPEAGAHGVGRREWGARLGVGEAVSPCRAPTAPWVVTPSWAVKVRDPSSLVGRQEEVMAARDG